MSKKRASGVWLSEASLFFVLFFAVWYNFLSRSRAFCVDVGAGGSCVGIGSRQISTYFYISLVTNYKVWENNTDSDLKLARFHTPGECDDTTQKWAPIVIFNSLSLKEEFFLLYLDITSAAHPCNSLMSVHNYFFLLAIPG